MNQHRLESLAVQLRNGALAGAVVTILVWAGDLQLWIIILAFALTCILGLSSIIAAILFYADEARRSAVNGWKEARKEYKAGVQPR